MIFREAGIKDVHGMRAVRNSVHENKLSDPGLIPEEAYHHYLKEGGRSWVCEVDATIVGFAAVDTSINNVWALFVLPQFEKKGIGKKLHAMMLDWYFEKYTGPVWLSTDPKTRAYAFYMAAGWVETGLYGNGNFNEVKFEMKKENWDGRD